MLSFVMRDGCPKCNAPIGPVIEHPMDDANELHLCRACGHIYANPIFDFERAERGIPVAFWMPRERWDALPVYTGEPQGDATLYRDAEKIGVVHRWMGRHWVQATISFERSDPARHPY